MVRVDHGLNRRSRFLTSPRVALGCVAGIMAGLAIYSAWHNAYPPYPGTGPTSRAARGLDELHSDGSAILDSQGRQVLLRGMNVTGMLQARDIDPGATPTMDDFARMHAFGFDEIRLAMSWSRLEPQRSEFSRTYLREIKHVVDVAAHLGIYTVVDMYDIDWSYTPGGDGAPAWATALWLPRFGPVRPPWDRHLAPAVVGSYGIFWVNPRGHEDGDWRH